MTERFAPPEVTIRRYPDSGSATSWLWFAARKWAAPEAVKWARLECKSYNIPNRLPTFRSTRSPATCHLFCVLGAKLEEECGSEGEGEMRAARLQELEEIAARLLALARKLPPGQ
jgi:hypothetical protein